MFKAPQIRAILSLRGKIILLACCMQLLAATLVGFSAYSRMSELAMQTAVSGISAEAHLMARRLQGAFTEMNEDAAMLGQTPPIEGLARAIQSNGIDPLDGSTTRLWILRLEKIFSSIMGAKPFYSEISFIRLADQPVVITALTRQGDNFTPTENARSEWNNMPFWRRVLALRPGQSLIINMDFGKGHETQKTEPKSYVFMPVYYKNHYWGVIAIIADYENMFHHNLLDLSPDKEAYVVDSNGGYLYVSADHFFASYDKSGLDGSRDAPFIDQVKAHFSDEDLLMGSEKASYLIKLQEAKNVEGQDLWLVLRSSTTNLLRDVHAIQKRLIALMGSIILVCLFLAFWISRRLTYPLKEMTRRIASDETLPVDDIARMRQDEIGDLAKAFHSMTQKLAQEENLARTVFMRAFDGLFVLNESGLIIKINQAAAHLFGSHVAALTLHPVVELFTPPGSKIIADYMKKYDPSSCPSFPVFEGQVEALRQEGPAVPVDISFNGTCVDDKIFFIGIVRDGSNRKRRDDLKDAFASTVNNELRLPLTTLQDSLTFMKDMSSSQLDEKGKRLLDLAYNNCVRLSSFLDDVLDIERIAAGKMEYHLDLVNICPLVRYIVETQQDSAEENKVKLEVDDKCSEAFCQIDSGRFMQALVNLISNAIKFSSDGMQVMVTLDRRESEAIISVSDHGGGIPSDFIPHLFEKFSQAPAVSTKGKGGSGLGLNIAKAIITAFNGQIVFETEEGKGSTFSILLPLAAQQSPE